MKQSIIAALMLLSINAYSSSDILDRCELKTNQYELLEKENKKTICNAVFSALYDENVREYDYFLRVEAYGNSTTYTVELTSIMGFIGSDLVSRTSGVLKWNPDTTKVVLAQ